MWITVLICRICLKEAAKASFSDHCPIYFEWILLLSEMLYVAWYGPHGGKLHHLCQGWYIWSTWTKQNLHFDCHYIGNSNANRTTWVDFYCLLHARSRGFLETMITRHHLHRRMYFWYLSIMRFRLLFSSVYTSKHRNNNRPTYCESCGGRNLLQSAAICSRIHVE